jgi:hypothetical protein
MLTEEQWLLVLHCVKTVENNYRDLLKAKVGTDAEYDRYDKLNELRRRIEKLIKG